MTVIANSDGLTIVDDSVTSQSIQVSNLSGTITNLRITVSGITHAQPDDLDFLLVAPDGTTSFVFMSDAGGGVALTNQDFTVSDHAFMQPQAGFPLSGTFLPANYEVAETDVDFELSIGALNNPPAHGTATFASVFGGLDPNGTWTLYVRDDEAGESGSIGSWSLDILTYAAPAPSEYVPDDPLFIRQWYLRNTDHTGFGTGHLDLNVTYVWPDYTGDGVTIAVYDNGIQYDHPDLSANYDASQHVIVNGQPSNAYYLPTNQVGGSTGFNAINGHGTGMAGIAGAADNGEGIVGVAFDATLVGVYAPITGLGGSSTPSDLLLQGFEQLRNFDVAFFAAGGLTFSGGPTSPTWSPIYTSLEAAAAEGRGGLGTVLLNSVHNNGPAFGSFDTNASQWDSSRFAIHVGGIGDDGLVAPVATRSAAMHVSGFTFGSAAPVEWRGVWGTDLTGSQGLGSGDYIASGGTTSSVSMIAGVTALLLEANPFLGWRDVQSILVESAQHVGSDIGAATLFGTETDQWEFNAALDWNGGGRHYSIDYGYGLVDALAATRLAETWLIGASAATSANEAVVSTTVTPNPNPTPIPDDTGSSVTLTFDVTENIRIEDVQLRLGFTHPRAGQLEIVLTSPDGTESVIFHPLGTNPNSGSLTGWRYNSQEFRGELTAGTWTAVITDTVEGDAGSLGGNTALVFYGASDLPEDRYVYTNEFSEYADLGGRSTLSDIDGGIDTINAAAVVVASNINLNAGIAGSIDGHVFTIAVGSAIENAIGGDGDDTLTGNALANLLHGGRGNDTLDGGDEADQLRGGGGNDTLVGGVGADDMDGEAGTDVADYSASSAGVTVNLILGLGAGGDAAGDSLTGIENIIGSEQTDFLTGVDGVANVLDGGDGADLLFFDGLDTLQGGLGSDAAFVTNPLTSGAVSVNLATSSLETVWGGHFGDTLNASGTSTDVTIVGLGGADIITGGSGNDTFYTDSADTVVGGAGFDTVFGSGGGAITMNIATAQVENVWGSNNADNLDGSSVGATDITLVGFAGADQLRGGAGDDFLYFDHEDTVLEGGAGTDWAVAFSGSSAVAVNLATQGFENAWGSLSDDSISAAGLATAATIVGDAGDDIITGGLGADFLYGFNDNDTLDGGAGGNDHLVGGAGTDTFVFGAGWGIDTVWDWQDGQEQFDLSGSGATQFNDLAVITVGSHALVTFGGNQLWVLNGAGQVGANDFVF